MGVILQVALPSRVIAAARLQCGAAGAGASRGLGVCAEHARLAARGESARAMEIGDFLGRLRVRGAFRSVHRYTSGLDILRARAGAINRRCGTRGGPASPPTISYSSTRVRAAAATAPPPLPTDSTAHSPPCRPRHAAD